MQLYAPAMLGMRDNHLDVFGAKTFDHSTTCPTLHSHLRDRFNMHQAEVSRADLVFTVRTACAFHYSLLNLSPSQVFIFFHQVSA